MAEPLLLWEIKTIDGDAPAQLRSAVGQLLFYEYFQIRPRWADRDILRSVAFDQLISDELVEFLSWVRVGAFLVADDGSMEPLNALAEGVAGVLAKLSR